MKPQQHATKQSMDHWRNEKGIQKIPRDKWKLEEINAELKINENEHEMLGDEKEEKQDKSPDKNSPERL